MAHLTWFYFKPEWKYHTLPWFSRISVGHSSWRGTKLDVWPTHGCLSGQHESTLIQVVGQGRSKWWVLVGVEAQWKHTLNSSRWCMAEGKPRLKCSQTLRVLPTGVGPFWHSLAVPVTSDLLLWGGLYWGLRVPGQEMLTLASWPRQHLKILYYFSNE